MFCVLATHLTVDTDVFEWNSDYTKQSNAICIILV